MTTFDQVDNRTATGAGELAGRAKGIVIGQIDERSTQLGTTVLDHAQNVREIGDQLRAKGQDQAAKLADTVASKLEQSGFYLSETGGDRIVADMEALARRQPLLTLATGIAAGILAARLLKASASQRYYAQQPYVERFNENAISPTRGATASRYYED